MRTESRDGYLLATITGSLTLREGIAVFQQVFDVAEGLALNRILIDCLALEGVLSTMDRYQFATEMVDYIAAKGFRARTALVGRPPEVDGFGVLVFQNRGGDAGTFPEIAAALEWLQR